MSRAPEPLFLARRSYRRRRLADAAKFLPAVGLVLLLLPVLWQSDIGTRTSLVYIFSVWLILILAIAPISTRLSRKPGDNDDLGPEAGDGASGSGFDSSG